MLILSQTIPAARDARKKAIILNLNLLSMILYIESLFMFTRFIYIHIRRLHRREEPVLNLKLRLGTTGNFRD